MNQYWYLRNHKLFEQLNSTEIESLCIISNMKSAGKNDIIFFSEPEMKRIFILKTGMVKICREDANGREIITEMLMEGDVFGHMNASGSQSDYAIVLSDHVKLCFFEVSNFMKVLKSNPDLSLRYTDVVSEKLLAFQQKYEDLVFKDIDTRVLEFFRKYAKNHGKMKGDSVEMNMLLTHQEIADYTASSRQSVTTVINRLAEKGKIIYEGRKVIIPNIHNL
jgi:CRP/FNR family cyclic AMP-dependent transcriptional regulator